MTSPDFMRLALVQSALVADKVYPYPGVGCVLVWQDRVIAKGNNGNPGMPHAEIQVLNDAARSNWPLPECVLYSTLEPCCNTGLTGACTEAILKAGIRELHVAIEDPYHLVRGAGIKILRDAGLKIILGEYAHEYSWQIRRYLERFCAHCGWPIKD